MYINPATMLFDSIFISELFTLQSSQSSSTQSLFHFRQQNWVEAKSEVPIRLETVAAVELLNYNQGFQQAGLKLLLLPVNCLETGVPVCLRCAGAARRDFGFSAD